MSGCKLGDACRCVSEPQLCPNWDEPTDTERLRDALTAAFSAMKIAAALPGVNSEYDFAPAIAKAERALAR